MRILFVCRRFLPSTGGMQRTAFELYQELRNLAQVQLLSYGGSRPLPPMALTNFLLRSIWAGWRRNIDVVHFEDALQAPLAWAVSQTGIPVTITVHGLDITYKNRLYQAIVPRCTKAADIVIARSSATAAECTKRGIALDRIRKVTVGITDRFNLELQTSKNETRSELLQKLNIHTTNPIILLTVGRLVKRKGCLWFLQNVLPQLLQISHDYVYLIVGEGSLRPDLDQVIQELGLQNHVRLLGQLDDPTLWKIYQLADIYVAPNIPVLGDMEGFGIASLEAASFRLPVVASRLEGITDAISDTQNGFLVEPMNVSAFTNMITMLSENPETRYTIGIRAREYTLDKFSWRTVAAQFTTALKEAVTFKSNTL